MLENYGKCSGDKNSQALVQNDIQGDGLNNCDEDYVRFASIGSYWGNEMAEAMSMKKQMEKTTEAQKQVQDLEDRSSTAAKGYMVCHRLLGGDTPGKLDSSFSWETFRQLGGDVKAALIRESMRKHHEISNCGFGEGMAATKRQADIQESMRRIRQMDLKPYMWNTTEIRF